MAGFSEGLRYIRPPLKSFAASLNLYKNQNFYKRYEQNKSIFCHSGLPSVISISLFS